MTYIDFISPLHNATPRDYLGRMTPSKAETVTVAKEYGFDYWDGDRRYGYGGYMYDGRWRPVAEKMVAHYNLQPGQRILDVGCGKAFLLHEFKEIMPELDVAGVDISEFALDKAKPEVKPFLINASASELPFSDGEFDLVYSINTLHNLYCQDLDLALREIERVGRKNKYITVESYRTEQEKLNLMCWVLTGECFFHTSEWEWWFDHAGYSGDYSFIFFT